LEEGIRKAYSHTWGKVKAPFSILRMFTKIWKEYVFTPTLEDALSRTLEESLKELH